MGKVRNQFTFYRSYYDAIQALSKRDQSALILAVCGYAIYETEPKGLSNAAFTAFKLIKPTLDAGRKKAENGSMKGKANESKTEAKSKQGENGSEKEREKEIEIEIENELEVEVDVEGNPLAGGCDGYHDLEIIGGTLGKGVIKLSQAQSDSLLDTLGLDMFNHYVERLADYIIRTGAVVHNHYETILKWWKEDGAL